MAEETFLGRLTPLKMAYARWSGFPEMLMHPEEYDPDEVLAEIEEFSLILNHLSRGYAEDPERAWALAREIYAHRDLLAREYIDLGDWESFVRNRLKFPAESEPPSENPPTTG
jgi:hypothetical protein